MNFHRNMQLKKVTQSVKPVNTKIVSVGTYLPDQILKSDDIMAEINSDTQYGIPINWMSETMGILERRVSPSNFRPSDLAIPASQKAIDESGIDPSQIDLVIFCGIERDRPEPATAHTIQSKLKLNADHAFDMSNACFGFMHAIETASHFIRSGAIKYALICTGEVTSRVMNAAIQKLKKGVDRDTAQTTLGGLSVGDAGGAIVLGATEMGENEGFKLFNTKSDSSLTEQCYYEVEPDGTVNGHMHMGKIVGASSWMHRKIIDDTLLMLGWDKFDWMLSHQTGKRPYEKFQSFSTVDEEHMIKTYDTLGNITSATFPVNFEKLQKTGKLKVGDRIGGIHSGSGLVVGEFGYQM